VPPRKRVTIRDVATATGLSPAAVSYALRGLQTSAATQDRVRRVADELGYEAHPIARALASGRTGMIGVLCGSLEDLWQQALAGGISRGLYDHDHFAIILDAAGDPEREVALARKLRDQRVDGLIVQPVDPASHVWTELAETIPVVSVGDPVRSGCPPGEVVFDNRAAARAVLEHLNSFGHRRIAALTPTRDGTPDRPADVVVSTEAERLGIDVTVITSPQALPAAAEVSAELLTKPGRPTALFCFADSIAYGVYSATRRLGVAVPGEVSVVGFDNHPMSALLTPPLTSVDWDIDGIVTAATDLMFELLDGQTPRRVTCSPRLCRRDSTGPSATT
jgi:LacI family transcriptional regulator